MRYIILSFMVLFFVSCSTKMPSVKKDFLELGYNKKENNITIIEDLSFFPQNPSSYLDKNGIETIDVNQGRYEEHYFSIWNKIPSDTKEVAMWPFYSYKYGDMYGENLKLIEEEIFEKIRYNSDFDKYKTLNKRALTLKHLNIRAFPTSKPMFKDPSMAGEGFPFDYMQNSTISANKPILISHYSKDKKWAYIFTSFTGGWVESKDIVEIAKKYTDIWQKAKQIFLIKDDIPLYDENGNFLFSSRVGMVLPLIKEDDDSFSVLSVSSYKDHQPNFHTTKISKDIAHKEVIPFDRINLKKIFDEVSKSKYGWGGLFGERDCSSTVRDIYAPFGIWLPRNSYQQSKIGKVISFDNMSDLEKIDLIKKEAKPFRTLLYKKGHILIYVGTYKDEIAVFQNVWGIKTKHNQEDGRVIVGKGVYTSLKFGDELQFYDKDAEILKNLKSMNIIYN